MKTAELFERLNDEQRAAVSSSSDCVVVAGPGSGKTDTITAKVAHLLLDDVPAPQRVACLSYGNDAAEEFASRLRSLGIATDGRLFTGTAHSFCLSAVIRPYAALAGMPELASPTVLSRHSELLALGDVIGELGLAVTPSSVQYTVQRIRRARAVGDPMSSFDAQDVRIADKYEAHILARREIDFEGMVLTGLQIIRSQPAIADLVVSRYPWLAVDEYQDLFKPLHQLVLALRLAGAHVFAVGDPDQCVNEWAGGDPHYLQQLRETPGVQTIELRFNYRSGGRIVAAAQAGLGQARNYRAQPHREAEGQIFFGPVDGDLRTQSRLIADELIPQAVAVGTPLHQIAVLYRATGAVPDALREALTDAGIAYTSERDLRFPTSPIATWLRHAAARAIGAAGASTLDELVNVYRYLQAPSTRRASWLEDRLLLAEASESADPDAPTAEWVCRFAGITDLRRLLAADTARGQDLADLDELTNDTETTSAVREFARGTTVVGKVVVTTLHSSKGREFDHVILPALQQGILPNGVPWDDWRPEPKTLAADRRLFYVGLTRARYRVDLVYSARLTHPSPRLSRYADMRASQFVTEVRARLNV
jgi:DNA helicase-2/ATP-dependent DNA helicase PcrA